MSDRTFSFKDPIYEFNIRVVVTDDMKKWDGKYPNHSPAQVEDECHALFVRLKGKKGLIVIRPNSPLDDLAHEIGHAARAVMEHIGFKISFDNDEPLAYYEGYLTRMIHKKINRLSPLTSTKRRA